MSKLSRIQRAMLYILAMLFLSFVATSCAAAFWKGTIPTGIPLAIGSLLVPFAFALKSQLQEEL